MQYGIVFEIPAMGLKKRIDIRGVKVVDIYYLPSDRLYRECTHRVKGLFAQATWSRPNATQTTRSSDQRLVYCSRPIKEMMSVLPDGCQGETFRRWACGPRRDGGKIFRWIDCLAMMSGKRKRSARPGDLAMPGETQHPYWVLWYLS